jgi:hypothetical protein
VNKGMQEEDLVQVSQNDEGNIITNQRDILVQIKYYYKKLYTSTNPDFILKIASVHSSTDNCPSHTFKSS